MPWASKVHDPLKHHRAAIARSKGRQEYKDDVFGKMYNMAEWRDPRIGIRATRIRIEPLCRHCRERGIVKAAKEVDHIIPHKGDMDLFLDIENTQSLCKSCHSTKTGRESHR